MARVWIIGGILWVALLVYGMVDLVVTSDDRIRRLNRPLWVVIILLVPILGSVAWLTLGKGPVEAPVEAPDDREPPSPTTSWLSDEESDRRIRDLEEQLAALDEEESGVPQAEVPAASEEDAADAADAADGDGGADGSDDDDGDRHPHEAGRDDDGDASRG